MTWKREETWLQPEPRGLNDQLLNIEFIKKIFLKKVRII